AMKNQGLAEIADEEAMSQIRKGHETMCVVLTSRHKNLDTVRAVWSTGDIKRMAYNVREIYTHCTHCSPPESLNCWFLLFSAYAPIHGACRGVN
ncbi:hypothetical protein E2320_000987, partial [Naja naja]